MQFAIMLQYLFWLSNRVEKQCDDIVTFQGNVISLLHSLNQNNNNHDVMFTEKGQNLAAHKFATHPSHFI